MKRTVSPELEQELRGFVSWLRRQTKPRYSQETIKRMVRTIRYLSDFLNPLDFTEEDVFEFIDARTNQSRDKTIQNHLNGLRAFARYRNMNVSVPTVQAGKPRPRYIPTDEEVRKVLKGASLFTERGVRLRNTIWVKLAAYCGLRVSEIAKINVSDVEENRLLVRSSKREDDRYVPLSQEMRNEIMEYMEKYKPKSPNDTALFLLERRNKDVLIASRPTPDYVRKVIKESARLGSAGHVSPHSLRHWFATTLLKGGVRGHGLDTRKIQVLLGHKSIASTQIYTHISSEEAAEEVLSSWDKFFQAAEEIGNVRILCGSDRTKRGERDSNPRSHSRNSLAGCRRTAGPSPLRS